MEGNNVQEEIREENTDQVVPTNEVNNKKNNSSKKGLAIILIVVILLIAAALCYVLLFNKKNEGNNSQPTPTPPSTEPEATPVSQDNENKETNDELIDYILNQDITKIELNREDCDNNDTKTIDLDKESLTKILNDLKNKKLTKEIVGGAGASCADALVIQYAIGNDLYNIEILNDLIWIGKDKKLEKLLDEKCDNAEGKNCANDECTIQYNLNEKYSFDEFFK